LRLEWLALKPGLIKVLDLKWLQPCLWIYWSYTSLKRHFLTAIIFLIALACYAAGYSSAGHLGFALGAVFEVWFWLRLFEDKNSGN